MARKLYTALIAALLSLSPIVASAQCDLPTSKGNDFWVAFLWNNGEAGMPELTVTAVSDSAATMTVENPITHWSTTVTLNASSYSNMTYAEVEVPWAQGLNNQASAATAHGIHVTTTADVWLTAKNSRLASGDAATILPAQQLGTRYIVQDYPNTVSAESASLSGAELVLLAVENNTVITMTLPCNTQPATVPAGSTLTVTLQRGQTYLLVAPTPSQFTGMEVTSNGKPFALFQGNKITSVPNGNYSSGDHIYEQTMPIEAWGTDFIVTATHGRTWGDLVRITAADNPCTIVVDTTTVASISAYGTYDYHLTGNSTRRIHTSAPASATLVMASSTWNAEPGDVSTVTLTPLNHGVCDAMFHLKHTERCNSYYVAIATGQGSVAGMTLDGNSIASHFTGSGAYRHALLSVSEGTHALHCNNGIFTAYAYAMGNVESYAFPLSRSFTNYLNDTIELYDTVCQGQPVDTLGMHLAANVTLYPGDTIVYRDIIIGTVRTHFIVHLTVMPKYTTDSYYTITLGDTL